MKYKLKDLFDLKSAIIGAVVMGGMVFFINYSYGWMMAGTAALKQAAYTFLLGGIFVRLTEILTAKPKKKWSGIAFGTLVVSGITTSAVYGIHVMKGTPLPFASTLPTIFFATPGLFAVSWTYRMKMEKEKRGEV